MIRQLLEHVLIWLAASAVIVVGIGWAYAMGLMSHRTDLRVAALTATVGVLIFAAGLVQRSPLAVSLLVVLSALMCAFGLWLLADGARVAGLAYVSIGSTYVIGLGPASLRWLGRGRHGKGLRR
jgi:hypothetical protein